MSKIVGLVAKAPQAAQALVTAAQPKLATFIRYAKVELTPPTPGDIPKAIQGFGQVLNTFRTGRWKQIPVKEAWLNTIVATELVLMFFVGEIIGKGHLRGYHV